jgi:mannan endo-1,4-beta-mannosidase
MSLTKIARRIALLTFASLINVCIAQTSTTYEAESAIRSGGPTVVSNTSASGGKEVYINTAGYVKWTINITKSRTYQLEFQYRSPSGEKRQRLLIDGVDQEIRFTSVSGFSQMQVEKYLTAGTHTVQITKDWGLVYLDFLKITSPAITTEDIVRKECETGTVANATIVSNAAYSGGKGVRFVTTGQVTTTVTAPAAGYYGINIGYNATYGDKTQNLIINGVSQQIAFKGTTTRTTLSKVVSLNSGSNTIAISANWGYMDIDFIELVPGSVTSTNTFVKVNGNTFTLNNLKYTYLGTNAWYFMNLGAPGKGGNRARLKRELDSLAKIGVRNIRIQAGSEGPNSEQFRGKPALQVSAGVIDMNVMKGLDFLLDEMGKRNMKAIMCLNNMWQWSGGFGQYLVWAKYATSIPYPPPATGGDWTTYQNFASQFYGNSTSQTLYRNFIRQMVLRKNSINGKFYKADPAIMTWELANEARAMSKTSEYYSWINNTSTYIKSLDAFHLVTTGSEGDTPTPTYTNNDYQKDHNFPNIDYGTMHIWPENFTWYDPKNPNGTYNTSLTNTYNYINTHVTKTKALNKPLVLEEFGLARDNSSYNWTSGTYWRDTFYRDVFERVNSLKTNGDPVQGLNFWAWTGEGRQRTTTGNFWAEGDQFVGDPAHEIQGWYGVYNVDTSTKNIIRTYTAKINTAY